MRTRDLYTATYQGTPCLQYAKKGHKPHIAFDPEFKNVHKFTMKDRKNIQEYNNKYFK